MSKDWSMCSVKTSRLCGCTTRNTLLGCQKRAVFRNGGRYYCRNHAISRLGPDAIAQIVKDEADRKVI